LLLVLLEFQAHLARPVPAHRALDMAEFGAAYGDGGPALGLDPTLKLEGHSGSEMSITRTSSF
jgi:hypothetical protein